MAIDKVAPGLEPHKIRISTPHLDQHRQQSMLDLVFTDLAK